MSDQATRTSSWAEIVGAAPQLLVADIDAACGFFTRKLGFSIVFV